MNKELYKRVLQQQLLQTVQEQLGDDPCSFQSDGAPCPKAKVTQIMVLKLWIRGQKTPKDLNPFESLWSVLKKRVDKQKIR